MNNGDVNKMKNVNEYVTISTRKVSVWELVIQMLIFSQITDVSISNLYMVFQGIPTCWKHYVVS